MIKQDISENQVKNIFLGIGSNLGNKIINIEIAKSLLLENEINFISVSNYYETPSWPDPKKPKFINIVLKATCKQKPLEMINLCKIIETKLGRRKSPKNSPRVCDIDIIDYDGLVLNDKLSLPHARRHERNFVLLPLFEIEKECLDRVKRSVSEELGVSRSMKSGRAGRQGGGNAIINYA